MKEVRYFYCPDASISNFLPEEEAEHAIKVLRLQPHDLIFLTDGKGFVYQAEIVQVNNKNCVYNILSRKEIDHSWQGKIQIGVAPTKNINRIEWLVEKATEIGFDEMDFLNCQYSERRNINLGRLEKIAISAMKQSHKSIKPELQWHDSFKDYISQPFDGHKFIAHCYNEKDLGCLSERKYLPYLLSEVRNRDCLVLIGPEGDFSIQEVSFAIDKGFQPVSLGPSRLRTETAALMAVVMMHLNNVKI